MRNPNQAQLEAEYRATVKHPHRFCRDGHNLDAPAAAVYMRQGARVTRYCRTCQQRRYHAQHIRESALTP